MADVAHQERLESMGSAMQRLSRAREARRGAGSVSAIEPVAFEYDAAPQRSMATGLPRASKRAGLFSFGERARDAAARN